MLADAAEFAQHLRTCEREIQNVKAATEGIIAYYFSGEVDAVDLRK